jgi:hypothetical protein
MERGKRKERREERERDDHSRNDYPPVPHVACT